jgi:hypothetical protein
LASLPLLLAWLYYLPMEAKMKEKLVWSIFWATVAVFVVVLGMIFMGMPLSAYVFFAVLAAFFGLGVTLIVLTVRAKLKGLPKAFFLLTGASAVGLPLFAVLHNAVYALFIYFFGEGFWSGIGGDEPVFFMLAVFVSPIAFLVGAIGSIVLKFWKVKKSPSTAYAKRRAKRK